MARDFTQEGREAFDWADLKEEAEGQPVQEDPYDEGRFIKTVYLGQWYNLKPELSEEELSEDPEASDWAEDEFIEGMEGAANEVGLSIIFEAGEVFAQMWTETTCDNCGSPVWDQEHETVLEMGPSKIIPGATARNIKRFCCEECQLIYLGLDVRDAMWTILSIVYEEGPQVMLDGRSVNYDAAVNLMDDELREDIHRDLAPCTEQEFMDEYAKRHQERFGQKFVVN